ncbi:hypothetical protein DCAR_0625960 [Daucus carota subsp. sativus]|uniref:UBC core domain-containing protein n=1 Tax=Daucus carota subsp. sativus TaxID=79200 RepID=A0AAF1B7B9_DAUCS|nr:hypothetical protein DCAR_0625960 [Daucus carota subsp. sativus]
MATINNQDNNNNNRQINNIASSKQPLQSAKPIDTQYVLKSDLGISAFREEDNIFCWQGTITIGSKDTVFEGTEYKLSLSFPTDYPFKPPKVKFEKGCFHPNVDMYGIICLDILQKWTYTDNIHKIYRRPKT